MPVEREDPELEMRSKKWMLKKDEAHQQASRTRSFHHVTSSGLYPQAQEKSPGRN